MNINDDEYNYHCTIPPYYYPSPSKCARGIDNQHEHNCQEVLYAEDN